MAELSRKEKARLRSKVWYENNKDRVREYLARPEIKEHRREQNFQYRKNNFIKHVISAARNRDPSCNLEESDLIMPEYCPILHIPLEISQGKRTGNTPSIDRINNNFGYIKGNVQIISFRANRLKNDASFDELIALGDWAKCNIWRLD